MKLTTHQHYILLVMKLQKTEIPTVTVVEYPKYTAIFPIKTNDKLESSLKVSVTRYLFMTGNKC